MEVLTQSALLRGVALCFDGGGPGRAGAPNEPARHSWSRIESSRRNAAIRAVVAVEAPPEEKKSEEEPTRRKWFSNKEGGWGGRSRVKRRTQSNSEKPPSNKLWWLKNEDVDINSEKVLRQVNRTISRSGTVKEALQVVEEMKANGLSANEGTYVALITVCRRQKQGERALVVYGAMKSAGVSPGMLTFNTLIACCSQAQLLEDAFRIKDDMVAAGFKPDVVTYTSLMAVCARAGPYRGRANPAQRLKSALGIYEEMKAAEIKPDTITFNTLLYAAHQAKQPQKVLDIYAMMTKEDVKPNFNTFQILLESASQTGRLQKAEKAFGEMKAAGVRPKTATFNLLINACGTAPQPQVAKAWAYFEESKATVGAEADAETYGALITAACKGGDFERALEAYEGLKSAGFSKALTTATYNKLIHAAGNTGNLDKAFQVFSSMAEERCSPDVITYCSLVSACGKAGDASRALAVSEDMEALGVKPNQIVFHAMMGACGRAGKWEEAVSLHHRMQEQCPAEPPNMGTYTILFDACFGSKGAESALAELNKAGKKLEMSEGVKAALELYKEGEGIGVFKNINKDDLTRCDLRGLTRSAVVVALLALLEQLKDHPPVLDLVVVTGSDRGKGVGRKPLKVVPGREPKLVQMAEATFGAVGLTCKPLTTLTFQALTVEAPELRRWLEGSSEGGGGSIEEAEGGGGDGAPALEV